MTDTKRCTKCGQELPLVLFGKHSNTKDGYQHWCKNCYNKWSKDRYHKNRKSILEYQKTYRKRTYEDRLDNTIERYFAYLQTIPEVEI